MPLRDDKIHYAGQPIALVVADALAQASGAGTLIEVRYEIGTPTIFGRHVVDEALDPPQFLWPARGGISTTHEIVRVNRNTPMALRSPHEALLHFALESAMDEFAHATDVDPVALRLLNYTEIDPHSGRPFSTRALGKCLTEAPRAMIVSAT